ncbi:MAG: hypothetical protein REI09_05080 [Candidatus Dactylopiibacterium sp.]|nr:hypothetical protein [Candidatus Dactylopiibacterium sp.]
MGRFPAQADQAEGLRRLLNLPPPPVLACLACDEAATGWLAASLLQRARQQRVVVLDQTDGAPSVADALRVQPRFDLLLAARGELPPDACFERFAPGSELACVTAMAGACDAQRIQRQRSAELLGTLGARWDEWYVAAAARQARSTLVRAAAGVALVAPARRAAFEAAWRAIGHIAASGLRAATLIVPGRCEQEAVEAWCTQASREYGLSVQWRADLAGALQACSSAGSFAERLQREGGKAGAPACVAA